MTVAEAAILPDLPIIDPHHHIWDRGGSRYLAEDLRCDLDCGHRIVGTIHVECLNAYYADGPEPLRPVGETAFVTSTLAAPLQTRRGPVQAAAGIVAYADLARGPAVDEVLHAHAQHAGSRLVGVRYATAWHEGTAIRAHYATGPNMLELRAVREGIDRLGQHGLVYDVWAYFTQLGEVADAADACPFTCFVVDHCGGPIGIGPWRGRDADVYAAWSKGVAELALRPNVRMKLGGLGMPLAGFALHKRERNLGSAELAVLWAPYVLPCIEAFGPDRCMFESNWPVDRAAGDYGTVWNAFKRITGAASEADRAQLFSQSAAQTYNLQFARVAPEFSLP